MENLIVTKVSDKKIHTKANFVIHNRLGDYIDTMEVRFIYSKQREFETTSNKRLYYLVNFDKVLNKISKKYSTKMKEINIGYGNTVSGDDYLLINVPETITFEWSKERIRKFRIRQLLKEENV